MELQRIGRQQPATRELLIDHLMTICEIVHPIEAPPQPKGSDSEGKRRLDEEWPWKAPVMRLPITNKELAGAGTDTQQCARQSERTQLWR